MAAHAGFPHTDLHERITTLADLSSDACLQDFVWLRLSANAKRKRPHRNSRGCEYGYDDFAEFGRLMEERLGVPVRRLVRGHDHIQGKHRYEIYPRYQTHPALTINTMGRRLDDESDMLVPEFARGCVARFRRDRLPQVHTLPMDEAAIRESIANREKQPMTEFPSSQR